MANNIANTWLVLQGLQHLIQTELLIGGAQPLTGSSPFDLWNGPVMPTDTQSDLAKYGTNPLGTCTNAIYIGHPKETRPLYTTYAEIVPVDENVYRRAVGGKIWHETPVYFRVASKYIANSYATLQLVTTIADSAHLLMMKHAELPGVDIVQATKEEVKSSAGLPMGYFMDQYLTDYQCWGTIWWTRQEYFVSGGIIP